MGTAAKQDAPAQQASVIGRWQEPGGSDLVEFRADGALIEQSAGGDKIQGRYLLGGDELKIQLEGVDHLAFTIAVDAHTLELRDADGHVTRYQRLL